MSTADANMQEDDNSESDSQDGTDEDARMEERLRDMVDNNLLLTSQIHTNILNAQIAAENEKQTEQQHAKDEQETQWIQEFNEYCIKHYGKNANKFGEVVTTVNGMLKAEDESDSEDLPMTEEDQKTKEEEEEERVKDIISSAAFVHALSLDTWLEHLDPMAIKGNIVERLEDNVKLYQLASRIKKEVVTEHWGSIGGSIFDYYNPAEREDEEDSDDDIDEVNAKADEKEYNYEPDKDVFDQLIIYFAEDSETFVIEECIKAHESNAYKKMKVTDIQNNCECVLKTFLYSYLSICRALYKAQIWEIETYQYKERDKTFNGKQFRQYLEMLVRTRVMTKWFPIIFDLFEMDGFPEDWRDAKHTKKLKKTNIFIGALTNLLKPEIDQKVTEFEDMYEN